MIPVKFRSSYSNTWTDGYLVSIFAAPHASGGCNCVIAWHNPNDGWKDNGLQLVVRSPDEIRIARTRIPLLDADTSDTSEPLPDGAKPWAPTKSGLSPCVCGGTDAATCTC